MDNLNRGDFNKRVTLSNPVKTEDGSGGYTEQYVPFLTTWARVKDTGGARVFDDGVDRLIDRKDIYIYYRSALSVVNKDTRVLYNGKDFSLDKFLLLDEIKKIMLLQTIG